MRFLHKIKKRYFIFACIILIVIPSILFAWKSAVSSPQYSLYQLYKSIKAQDYNEFNKYVDIDSIANNGLDDVVAQAEAKVKVSLGSIGGHFGVAQMEEAMLRQVMTSIKPKLLAQLKERIKEQFENGDLQKAEIPDAAFIALILLPVEKKGDIATITVPIKDQEISFEMRKKGDHWQIYKIDFDFMDLGKIDPKMLRELMQK